MMKRQKNFTVNTQGLTSRKDSIMDELLNCPFCGCGNISWHKQYPSEIESQGLMFQCFCRRCGATPRRKATKELAITAWNTRHADKELVEALEKIIEIEKRIVLQMIKVFLFDDSSNEVKKGAEKLKEETSATSQIAQKALARHKEKP